MATLNSKYKIKNRNGEFDVYHLESNQNMIKVLNSGDDELGTLGELMFTGKQITSGSITDIKVSGTYEATGVTGLPSGLSSSKTYLLQVDAIGPIGNPKMINYTIVDDAGSIYYKTTTSTSSSTWSSGGTSAANTMNGLLNGLGDVGNLKLNKGDIVSAVNELYNTAVNNTNKLNEHDSALRTHNHDSSYVTLGKESDFKTTLNMMHNSSIKTKSLDGGTVRNLISVDQHGNVVIGDTSKPITINASDISLNGGGKVWTSSNDGAGSGLDADRLAGRSHNEFAIRNGDNNFRGTQSIQGGLDIKGSTSLKVGNLSGTVSNTAMTIVDGNGKELFGFSQGNGISSYGMIVSPSANGSGLVKFKQNASDAGVDMYVDEGTGDFRVQNKRNGATTMDIKKNQDYANFNNGVGIDGKKLYIQDNQPEGNNHPVGSIWIAP